MPVTDAKLIQNPLRRPVILLRRYIIYTVVVAIILVMSLHLLVYGTDWSRMGSPSEIADIAISLLPNLEFIPKIITPLMDTALMAFWGTLLAVVMSVPVSYLAASTTTPSMIFTFPIGRGLIVLSRSTHEIIFALIFVATLGLGPLPGILALACRSVGFMSKTTAEAMENVDRGPVEAIASTGAARPRGSYSVWCRKCFPFFSVMPSWPSMRMCVEQRSLGWWAPVVLGCISPNK